MGAWEDFLENSTIHGLVYISTAKSFVGKAIWAIIVALSFGFAAYLIAGSYAEWIQSPVSTVVSTRPISDLHFPEVTVCPPKGSNTALNQVLERIKDEELTPELWNHLRNMINKMFIIGPIKRFAKNMSQMINVQNGKVHIPEKTVNLIHFQLDISTLENLTIQAEEGKVWKRSRQYKKLKLHRQRGAMNFSAAEALCVSLGGHLASIQSEAENADFLREAANHLKKAASRVWLGGTDIAEEGKWVWTDGRSWNFTNWAFAEPDNENNSDCMLTAGKRWYDGVWYDGSWHDGSCSDSEDTWPLCHVEPRTTKGTQQIDLGDKTGSLLHIWLDYNLSDPLYYEDHNLRINLTWQDTQQADLRKIPKTYQVESQRLELQAFYKNLTWIEAKSFCISKGGHLASITSEYEQHDLFALVGNGDFWLGGSDEKVEGNWTWSDGMPWKTDHWNHGEPNGRQGENCLAIMQGGWGDNVCSTNLDGFVCRLPTTIINFWNLARVLSVSNQHERNPELIWNGLVKSQRLNQCLDTAGEAHAIEHLKKELNVEEADLTGALVSDEDLSLALETFSFLHFCLPPNMMEAAKLGIFFWRLLEKENMRTFVLATLNTMLYEESKVKYNMDLLNEIFYELDKSYNFILGPSILALASTTQLRQLANKDFPFLKDYRPQIQHCLEDPKCKTLTELALMTGEYFSFKKPFC